MQAILQKFVCRLLKEDGQVYASFREEDGYFLVTEAPDIGVLEQALQNEQPVIVRHDECLTILSVRPGLGIQPR